MDTIYKYVYGYDGDAYMLECKVTESWGRYIHYIEPDGSERTTTKRFDSAICAHMQKSYFVLLTEKDDKKARDIITGYFKKKMEEHYGKSQFFKSLLTNVCKTNPFRAFLCDQKQDCTVSDDCTKNGGDCHLTLDPNHAKVSEDSVPIVFTDHEDGSEHTFDIKVGEPDG